MPSSSLGIDAQLQGAVGFGVGERLMLTFVPSPAAKGPDIAGKFLLKVDAETVLNSSLLAGSDDIGNLGGVCKVDRDGVAIVAHVGVVDEVQETDGRIFVLEQLVTQFQLDVLGARSSDVSVQVGPVGNLGHQGFGEAQAPVAIFVIENRSHGVATG